MNIKKLSSIICLIAFAAAFIEAHDRSQRRSSESRDQDRDRDGHGHSSHERRGGPYPRRSSYEYRRHGRPGWNKEPSTTSPRDVCPCVKRKDTGQCVTYDPRFQAATVEEAILNFPDLQVNKGGASAGQAGEQTTNSSTGPSPPSVETQFGPVATSDNLTFTGASPAKSRVGPKKGQDTFVARQPPIGGNASIFPPSPLASLCGDDQQCQECSTTLLNRLSGTGLLQGAELEEVSRQFGLLQAPRRRNCDKYKFGKPPAEKYMRTAKLNGTTVSADPALDNLLKQLQDKGEENWRKRQQAQSRRNKRQPSTKPGNVIGQQFKIDCSKRGEPVEQGSTWVGLCNVCWAWRKLPASYFPQYVNELICDTDTKCMSGFGACQQRYKSVDILQNTGTDANPTWKQVTISVANYCDCEVESGSGMHNFVAA